MTNQLAASITILFHRQSCMINETLFRIDKGILCFFRQPTKYLT